MSEWRRGAVGLNSEGHAEMWIQRFLSSLSVSLDSTNGKACALCHAAETGHIDVLKLLLKKGVDVNSSPFKEKNPRRNRNVNAPWEGSFDYPPFSTDEGRRNNALHCAVQSNQLEAVTILLRNGANIETPGSNGGTALHTASQHSDISIVIQLLESGCDINARDKVNRTPLWVAVQQSNVDTVKVLIASGAALDIADEDGKTPLHVAASVNQDGADVAKLLIQAGASLNMMDKEGLTPLLTALSHQQTAIANMIINAEYSTEPEHQPTSRSTTLISAAEHGLKDVVQCLINKGCDLNACDHSGNTALHKAVQMGYQDVAEVLLTNGADVNVKNNDQNAPLHYVDAHLPISFVQLLIKHNADIDIQNEHGMTPLYLHVWKQRIKVEQHRPQLLNTFLYLLQQGADPNICDNFHTSPLHKAISTDFYSCAITLMQHGCQLDHKASTYLLKRFTEEKRLSKITKDLLTTMECVFCTGTHLPNILPQIQNLSPAIREFFTAYEMNPLTLKQLARIRIRQTLSWGRMQGIDDLPVPNTIKDYLWMKEFFNMLDTS
ncbi:unnamed protein product [Owenia fusiformis]|uniref:Uncharacterized protein n=1 Tax=Owenia fusiformis TaxID=6347 RepID=A0A8J1T7B7_OWEFU|nr:unnamed protein product [Owenia fusiformis]